MSKHSIWTLKLRVSLSSALRVLKRPTYVLLVAIGTLLASGFIIWSLNIDLVAFIVFDAPLNLYNKFEFFFDVYKDIFTTYGSSQSTGIVVFSVLFGINLALLVFVIKNQGFKSMPKKSSVGGFAMAIVGGGCIACGTSLAAPLLATFGATATPLARELSTILLLIGSLLIAYSIYKLGLVCSYIQANQDLTSN